MSTTNITTIRTYNLVNANGDWLQLKLGRINVPRDVRRVGPDYGFRWSFKGTKIPMPVRSETWFNGFPEETMLNWLKANGWYPRTCVIPDTGYAIVYDLPDEPDKADEEDAELIRCRDKFSYVFHEVLQDLIKDGWVLKAERLYRFVYGVDEATAIAALREIRK